MERTDNLHARGPSLVKNTTAGAPHAIPHASIPDIGGFAALSCRFPNARISAGYRADLFFGAKDSGLETRATSDVGFHGPFATISIGLGG